ncbi:hypothetical protein DICPUDRAFT_150724 [Dictyostelium purpureum]|uniref:Adenylate kinase n=1 Tax=Dictyostelium purpureum TaxID=5786 RepID=F0ZH31_DICPU|nr:uncharacterized protein DICPUDRAFT_150724 [Dictyostelium purpureum]EGC36762.1 hypothetical protein DICPUDRAFT_150724 [Dictyostelium purpureum]|eukprot:XP_003286708.1 hypothetical protein DICPUDRAFT_150724 [Dictyostelium purpureum]
MIKGTTVALKEISSNMLRRGSKDFGAQIHRRNSICGPCIGVDVKQSKHLDDISNFLENAQNIQDIQLQEHIQSKPVTKNDLRKNSISNILSSISTFKKESKLNKLVVNQPRRFSIDPLSFGSNTNNIFNEKYSEKFKNINLSERFMETEAETTFNSVWSELSKKYGVSNLNFPKQIIYLAGAPGSGKGTNTEALMEALGVNEDPIVMSSLLDSPECIKIKKEGGLVNDKVVLELLLTRLCKPNFMEGNASRESVIVDGFPRSAKQVKFIELLYDKICYIKRSINPEATLPRFRVSVLHVSEEESVKRQLSRGEYAIKENIQRKEKELPLIEIRDTDIDPMASKKRYSIYQEQFNHLKSLEKKFDFDLIDANGSKSQVKQIIMDTYA